MSSTLKSPSGAVTLAIREYRETGSPEAFRILYMEFQRYIFSIAKQQLGPHAKLMDPEDVVQSVMGSLAIGLGEKATWFVECATDQQALRGMLGYMTYLHCQKVFRYENVRARRIIQRDADCQHETPRSSQIVDAHSNHEIVVHFKLLVEQIANGLTQEHATQGPEYARVFQGLLKYESIEDIANTLNASRRTVDRRIHTVRAYVAKQLEKLSEELNVDAFRYSE
jgi:ECF sigma factor